VDVLAVVASAPETAAGPARYLGDQGARSTIAAKARFAWAAVGAAQRCDVIVCTHVAVASVALALRWLLGIPYIVVGHGTDVWKPLGVVRRAGLRGAAAVVAVSRFTADALAAYQRIPRRRLRIVYPAVRPALLGRGRPRTEPPGAQLTLLTVARLSRASRHKSCDTVLRALPALAARGIPLRYVIVGDGDDRARLETLARSLGVGQLVTFRGQVSVAELADEYRRCDVFVMPSVAELRGTCWSGEGLGLAYLEAAAFGCAIVGGLDGGAPEAVDDGVTGMTVDGRDVDAVSAALIRLAAQPALRARMGEAGAERVRSRFSFPRFRGALWYVLAAALESAPVRQTRCRRGTARRRADPARIPAPAGRWSEAWPLALLACIVLLAATLRLSGVAERGFGNPYFSAAVVSMSQSWHNFFYDAFDPAGFVSLDKPPVAFWIQVGAAKLAGFSGRAVLLPQALEGVAGVVLLYVLVRRRFGIAGGLLASLFLAVTPVSVVMDRGSGTDSCLMLVLLLAAWAAIAAAETGRLRMLLLAMAGVGIAFNVKMTEALGVVPAFLAVYYIGAPGDSRRKLRDLASGAAVLAVVSLAWPTFYDLTPRADRPFVGSTTHNSMLELAAVYNGLDRFLPRVRRDPFPPTGGPLTPPRNIAARGGVPGASPTSGVAPSGATLGAGRAGIFGGGVPVGPLRLADPRLADQAGWLLPLVVIGALAPLWNARSRRALTAVQLNSALWSIWAFTYAIVYSYAGGMFRPYYLLAVAPPLAALAGVGSVRLWAWCRAGRATAWRVPAVLVATAAWQARVLSGAAPLIGRPTGLAMPAFGGVPPLVSQWARGIEIGFAAATAAAVAGLMVARVVRGRASHGVAAASLALGLAAILVVPTMWAWSSGLPSRPGRAAGHSAGRPALGPAGADPKLVAFLEANHGNQQFLLATPTALEAAPLIIRTGDAVMAFGGFTGRDPILTPAAFAEFAALGKVRFVLLSSGGTFGPLGGQGDAQADLIAWIRAHGRIVRPSLWRSTPPAAKVRGPASTFARRRRGRLVLYDLVPTEGLRSAASVP
jgi:4-amino-4-deoxy-L-arabinose transferase-like glycosyltransferase/glycosyltransferase involved in cell wall biosynthesis